MRSVLLLAACGMLVACGDVEPPREVRAQASALRFVKPPLVVVNDSGNVQVWVRLDRPLRDNEGSLGEHPDYGADIEIPGTTPDIPTLYRDDLHPTCYGQFLFGDVADGEQVSVALVLGPDERIVATAAAETWEGADVDARALRRLRCPSDRGATRRCRGSVTARYMGGIDVRSGTNASCRTVRAVMRSVGRWASSGGNCYETLCAGQHRMNRGFRCSAELVGEAAWQITCVRGNRVVRGYAAD